MAAGRSRLLQVRVHDATYVRPRPACLDARGRQPTAADALHAAHARSRRAMDRTSAAVGRASRRRRTRPPALLAEHAAQVPEQLLDVAGLVEGRTTTDSSSSRHRGRTYRKGVTAPPGVPQCVALHARACHHGAGPGLTDHTHALGQPTAATARYARPSPTARRHGVPVQRPAYQPSCATRPGLNDDVFHFASSSA